MKISVGQADGVIYDNNILTIVYPTKHLVKTAESVHYLHVLHSCITIVYMNSKYCVQRFFFPSFFSFYDGSELTLMFNVLEAYIGWLDGQI